MWRNPICVKPRVCEIVYRYFSSHIILFLPFLDASFYSCCFSYTRQESNVCSCRWNREKRKIPKFTHLSMYSSKIVFVFMEMMNDSLSWLNVWVFRIFSNFLLNQNRCSPFRLKETIHIMASLLEENSFHRKHHCLLERYKLI